MRLRTLSLSACGAALLALTVVHGQTRATALTALDYIQIQQVVFEAQYALLAGLDDGRLYAQQFTANGAMNDIGGAAALTAHAKGGRPGVRSLLTNVIIEPTAQGACSCRRCSRRRPPRPS